MASGDEAVLQRLDALIVKGNAVQNTGSQLQVQPGPFHGWRAQVLSTLERTVGSNDAYHRSFVARVNRTWKSDTAAGVAILQALRDDVQAGHLTRLTDLVVAAVFTDFIAMADHLLREGYKDPAASLTGAVLEDGLRKMATSAGVAFAASDGIDALNKKCAGAGVYSALKQSQVDTWRIVRNDADHGHFDAYAAEDVAAMIIGVQALLIWKDLSRGWGRACSRSGPCDDGHPDMRGSAGPLPHDSESSPRCLGLAARVGIA